MLTVARTSGLLVMLPLVNTGEQNRNKAFAPKPSLYDHLFPPTTTITFYFPCNCSPHLTGKMLKLAKLRGMNRIIHLLQKGTGPSFSACAVALQVYLG